MISDHLHSANVHSKMTWYPLKSSYNLKQLTRMLGQLHQLWTVHWHKGADLWLDGWHHALILKCAAILNNKLLNTQIMSVIKTNLRWHYTTLKPNISVKKFNKFSMGVLYHFKVFYATSHFIPLWSFLISVGFPQNVQKYGRIWQSLVRCTSLFQICVNHYIVEWQHNFVLEMIQKVIS